MNKLTLTLSEIIALKQAHPACKDKLAADRIKAVYSLGMGFSVKDVVSILMLDEETLRNYVKRYHSGGITWPAVLCAFYCIGSWIFKFSNCLRGT